MLYDLPPPRAPRGQTSEYREVCQCVALEISRPFLPLLGAGLPVPRLIHIYNIADTVSNIPSSAPYLCSASVDSSLALIRPAH